MRLLDDLGHVIQGGRRGRSGMFIFVWTHLFAMHIEILADMSTPNTNLTNIDTAHRNPNADQAEMCLRRKEKCLPTCKLWMDVFGGIKQH